MNKDKKTQLKWTCIYIAVSFIWIYTPSAKAQLNQFPPGVPSQMMSGYLPPAGTWVVDNSTIFYDARKYIDASGNSTDFDTTVLANRTALLWTSPYTLWGGDLGLAGVFPITNFASRPQPGHESEIGLGDIYLQPLTLGWHRAPWHFLTAYGIFAPTGRFTYGASNNTGRGFWAHRFNIGTTYLQESHRPWHGTVSMRYDLPGQVKGTNIYPGQTFIFEYSGGKKVTGRWDLGLLGYWVWQTTGIKGSDQRPLDAACANHARRFLASEVSI